MYVYHRDLHVLTPSFPTRRSSDLVEPISIEHRRKDAFIDSSLRRHSASRVERGVPLLLHPVIDKGARHAGIKGGEFAVLTNIGDVRYTAEVQDGNRLLQRFRKSAMIDRQERRALPSRRQIGREHVCTTVT